MNLCEYLCEKYVVQMYPLPFARNKGYSVPISLCFQTSVHPVMILRCYKTDLPLHVNAVQNTLRQQCCS